MGLDTQLELTKWVDDVTPVRDGLKIWDFKRMGVEVRPSKGAVEFFGSDQIRSVWVSTERDEFIS